MSGERRRVALGAPLQGWTHPWPNLFELARVLPSDRWTLVGGVMVQGHALAHGVPITRPTDDLDVLLHIEINTSVTEEAHRQITQLGYKLREPDDARKSTSPHYRYERTSPLGVEKIDVMSADHAAPRVRQRLAGRPMFQVEGGTQALQRTMIYVADAGNGESHPISVPDELAALVLKSAAYQTDTRDRDRHLQDAAVLAACITDHATELGRLAGSDRRRISRVAKALADPLHAVWITLDEPHRTAAQDTLRILSAPK